MFGISYGELFIIIGATAALIGPKDLPKIARTAGRLAGRSIGYVQMARGQFDNIMQQSQVTQVHKELQETMAQLEAIRYEIRSVSIMNPGPFTRRFDGALPPSKDAPAVATVAEETIREIGTPVTSPKDLSSGNTYSSNLHSEAMAYAKLAEAPLIKTDSYKGNGDVKKLKEDGGLLNVLPISAESAGLLPKLSDAPKGSDIVLEAILEAEVARNAKHFFSQPENQIPKEWTGIASELHLSFYTSKYYLLS